MILIKIPTSSSNNVALKKERFLRSFGLILEVLKSTLPELGENNIEFVCGILVAGTFLLQQGLAPWRETLGTRLAPELIKAILHTISSGGSRGGHPLFWVKEKSQKEEKPSGQAKQNHARPPPFKFSICYRCLQAITLYVSLSFNAAGMFLGHKTDVISLFTYSVFLLTL